ncbi:MAG: transglutaminase-like domain-containing protein [Acidobacteria bacterium]|nr:transglutaminase-like domain-containing protein [Acidobacteriota bacterium]
MKRLLPLLLLLAAPSLVAQEATYVVRGPQLPVETVANGYQQNVVALGDGSVRVRVATWMGPIGSQGVWTRGVATDDAPAGFHLPGDLSGSLHEGDSSWRVATRILEWVMGGIRLDVSDRGPQDAEAVLVRRVARCSGLANATVALLRTAGFQARTVSGLLVGHGRTVPHRWIECRLPGAGWVPSDPTLGLWVVTPGHLAFSRTVANLPAVTVVAGWDAGFEGLPDRGGLPLRPNRGAELVCRLVGNRRQTEVVAELVGPGGARRRAALDPEASFNNLLPGRWSLTVRWGGRIVERRAFVLTAGEASSYAVRLAADPEIG